MSHTPRFHRQTRAAYLRGCLTGHAAAHPAGTADARHDRQERCSGRWPPCVVCTIVCGGLRITLEDDTHSCLLSVEFMVHCLLCLPVITCSNHPHTHSWTSVTAGTGLRGPSSDGVEALTDTLLYAGRSSAVGQNLALGCESGWRGRCCCSPCSETEPLLVTSGPAWADCCVSKGLSALRCDLCLLLPCCVPLLSGGVERRAICARSCCWVKWMEGGRAVLLRDLPNRPCGCEVCAVLFV